MRIIAQISFMCICNVCEELTANCATLRAGWHIAHHLPAAPLSIAISAIAHVPLRRRSSCRDRYARAPAPATSHLADAAAATHDPPQISYDVHYKCCSLMITSL